MNISSEELTRRILYDLLQVEVLFENWINDIMTKKKTYYQILMLSLQLRSVYEIKYTREGCSMEMTNIQFHPFSDDNLWIEIEDLTNRTKGCLLALLQKPPLDNFRTIVRNLTGTKLHYKHFPYDDFVNEYLEKGLGLLLFLNVLEKKIDSDFIDLNPISSILQEKTLELIPYTPKKAETLIDNMFSDL